MTLLLLKSNEYVDLCILIPDVDVGNNEQGRINGMSNYRITQQEQPTPCTSSN